MEVPAEKEIENRSRIRRPKANLFAIPFLFACFLATDIQAQVNGYELPGQADLRSSSERVHYGDVIDVDVVGSTEYDWRGSLTPEGFLDGSDQLGVEIYGLCRTEAELAKAIGEHYSRILRNPKVVVRILDRSNRPTALLTGAVQNPARFQIRRAVRLNELIVLTGGLTDTLGGDIRVFRPPNLSCAGGPPSEGAAVPASASSNQPISMDIRITDLLAGIPDANPYILSGDVVTVNEAAPVYVIGGVNSPQAIPSRGDLSVSRAIAAAGGVARNGIETAVTVYRRSGGTTQVIEMDLRAIDAESAEDITLLPFDIVDVGMRGREKRSFPPVILYDRPGMGDGKLFPLRIVD